MAQWPVIIQELQCLCRQIDELLHSEHRMLIIMLYRMVK